MIFDQNRTHFIAKFNWHLAQEFMWNNNYFEISLLVFMPNTTANEATVPSLTTIIIITVLLL